MQARLLSPALLLLAAALLVLCQAASPAQSLAAPGKAPVVLGFYPGQSHADFRANAEKQGLYIISSDQTDDGWLYRLDPKAEEGTRDADEKLTNPYLYVMLESQEGPVTDIEFARLMEAFGERVTHSSREFQYFVSSLKSQTDFDERPEYEPGTPTIRAVRLWNHPANWVMEFSFRDDVLESARLTTIDKVFSHFKAPDFHVEVR